MVPIQSSRNSEETVGQNLGLHNNQMTRTWQYSITGSMICFQMESTSACSSFEFTVGTTPPKPGIAPENVRPLPSYSEATGDLFSANTAVSGVAIIVGVGTEATGVKRDRLVSTVDEGSFDAKNWEMKVYSAVALSMKTRRRERSKASTGSFWSDYKHAGRL